MAIRKTRILSGMVAGGLLLGGLTACSGNGGTAGGSADAGTASGGAGISASASASLPSASASGSPGAVDCSGASCSVTLDSGHATVTVLGNTLSLGSVQNGKATLGVDGKNVSCSQGDSVTAGPLTLTCSSVTDKAVTVTAKLG